MRHTKQSNDNAIKAEMNFLMEFQSSKNNLIAELQLE